MPAVKPSVPVRREGTTDRPAWVVGTLTTIVVGAIGLSRGNETWASVLFLLTVALLGASFVAIWHRQQDRRAFWQGFALFGCGYLVLSFVPLFPHLAGLELPTSRLVRIAHAKATASAVDTRESLQIMKSAPVAPAAPVATMNPDDRPRSQASMVPAAGNLREFMIVGHCWFTLLAALTGSAIAGWFYRSNLRLS
jgi:hypothetical protein